MVEKHELLQIFNPLTSIHLNSITFYCYRFWQKSSPTNEIKSKHKKMKYPINFWCKLKFNGETEVVYLSIFWKGRKNNDLEYNGLI